MLLLLFMLSVSSECGAQFYMYGGPVPYRRAPGRRSPMEALERLRAPVARYYPQSDYADDGGLYALPPQWTDPAPQYTDEGNDEDEYEYEAPLGPVYRAPVESYQEIQDPRDLMSYGDLMRGYMMPPLQDQPPVFLQRRSDGPPAPPTQTSSAAPLTAQQTESPTSATQVEKKSVQSLVLPDPAPKSSAPTEVGGQKEVPLFRPLHNSQRTTEWNTDHHKSAIPMLKQMIEGMQKQQKSTDPLLEELSSLKKA